MATVLILANDDLGLYKFRRELLEELLKHYEVIISIPYGEFVNPLITLGTRFIPTKIDRRGVNPIKDFKLFLKYLRMIREIKPDFVITYTIKPGIYGGLASRVNRITYAVNITGLGSGFYKEGLLKKLIIHLYRLSCKQAKVVIFENDENKSLFLDHDIVSEEKACKVNGAGVNLKEYSLFEFPVDTGGIRFLFIGRIMKEKGMDELLEAARKIKTQPYKVYFDVIGPLEDDYQEQLKDLQQKDIIHYYGYQKDVRPFIERAHCIVLPSYHEGMANTLLECGAMGRAIITTDIPGCREAVIDGENGYLTRVMDSEHLYENIIKFIKLDPQAKKTMGLKSRKHMEANFDKSEIITLTIRKLGL